MSALRLDDFQAFRLDGFTSLPAPVVRGGCRYFHDLSGCHCPLGRTGLESYRVSDCSDMTASVPQNVQFHEPFLRLETEQTKQECKVELHLEADASQPWRSARLGN